MTTPAQPPAKGGSKKFPSMRSPVTWVVILGIAVAGGAYLLYRRSKNQAAATTTATTAGTTDATDLSGQIATLQAEVADLQSAGAQDEAAEAAPAGTPPPATLAAPSLTVTAAVRSASFSWSAVSGAKAYELVVAGAGGKGTGTSHYDHVVTGTSVKGVGLAQGRYVARVRAGKSATDVHGPWSASRSFEVKGRVIGGGKPPVVKKPPKEPED